MPQAEQNLTKAKELCTELISLDPADQKAKADLLQPILALSQLRQSLGELDAAEEQLQSLLTVLEPLLGSPAPEDEVIQACISALLEMQKICILRGDMESFESLRRKLWTERATVTAGIRWTR